MKINRRRIAGTLLVAACLLSATLSAAPPDEPHGWGPHHPPGPAHWFHQLTLTDVQKQSADALVAAAAADLKGLHEQLRANRGRLHGVTPDDPGYAAVLAEVSQSDGNLHTQLEIQEGNLYSQLYGLLSPAQKAQLAALQAKASPPAR